MAIYNEDEDPNVTGLDTTKKDLIESIKDIISEFGGFGIGEVEADCSPNVPYQKGNLCHLIEYFDAEKVDVEVYVSNQENSIDSYSLFYYELDTETLEQILEHCKTWGKINIEEEE